MSILIHRRFSPLTLVLEMMLILVAVGIQSASALT